MLATIPVVGSFFTSAANDVFGALASALEDASSWAVSQMIHAITATTTPDLTSGWFSGPSSPLHTMRLVVLAVGVPIIILGVMQSLLRNDVSEMARRAFLYPALAGAGTLAVVAVTTMLVTATDQMSSAMLASAGKDLGKFAAQTFAVAAVTGPATPSPVMVLVGLSVGILAAGFLIWLELVVRMAAIDIAVLFMPLALIALCWQAGAAAAKRLAEFLVAVILSKFVIAATIAVGAASLAAPVIGNAPGKETARLVGGMALLLLAGFAPVALLRWIPLAEAAAASHGLARQGAKGAMAAASTIDRARSLAGSRSPADKGSPGNQGGADTTGTAKTGGAAEKAGGAGGAAAGAAGPAGAAVVAAQAAAKVVRQAGGVTDAAGGGNGDKGGNGPSQAGGERPGATAGSQGASSDKPSTGAVRG